jgi:hypothetical protein
MYVRSIAEAILVLTAQKQNIAAYQTEVAATAQDITDISDELTMVNWIESFGQNADTFKKTAFQVKDTVLRGTPGDPVGAFAVPPSTVGAPVFKAGVFTIINERNKRFDAQPTCSAEARDALLLGAAPTPPPGIVKPVIVEVHAAPSGGVFGILITDRADSTSWVVEAQVVGTSKWALLGGGATGKSADFVYPITNDAPVQLLVRVRLKKANADYGEPSEPALVTVNP